MVICYFHTLMCFMQTLQASAFLSTRGIVVGRINMFHYYNTSILVLKGKLYNSSCEIPLLVYKALNGVIKSKKGHQK